MARLFGFLLIAALLVMIGVALGGAIDDAYREHVLVPAKDGSGVVSCERVVKETGDVYFENCSRVP